MTPRRRYEVYSDEALQELLAQSDASERDAVLSEVLFRTRDALNAEMRTTNTLTTRIHNLNVALLWYTVALAMMAAFQFGAWIRDVVR
jgi:hypothetical protein